MGELPGTITLAVDCEGFETLIDESLLLEVAERTLRDEHVHFSSIGIVLSGHSSVRELNRRYLEHDFETDVLSFLIEESTEGIEGEVYVDLETAQERCSEFDSSLADEVARYVIHGLLHLAGYSDDNGERKDEMRVLEDRYLQHR